MNKEQTFLILIASIIGAVILSFFWWVAGQEANAYHRATGKKVSQWDALFLELRVQNQ